mmetsp:Transcript_17478/g.29039  ORF Transcript_17478/g.29039 Transcript_17478/m.29039 type:complete len:213 (-) Transcript_17478:212-850(-)
MDLIECVSEILPGQIWIADMYCAMDPTILDRLEISHIVNASNQAAPNVFSSSTYYCSIDEDDDEYADLWAHFDRAIDFIDGALSRGGRVLVHCVAGVSRASTLVIAFLMKTKKMSAKEAWLFVKARRPCICPNRDFAAQILGFESGLPINCKKPSIGYEEICKRPAVRPPAHIMKNSLAGIKHSIGGKRKQNKKSCCDCAACFQGLMGGSAI